MPSTVLTHNRPTLYHGALQTTFCGVEHDASTPDAAIQQFRGIKFASVPARFRQSKLHTSYHTVTDATEYGPICPQAHNTRTCEERLFGVDDADLPSQRFKQNELECLNLNITRPADLTPQSRVPVMLWIHGGGDRGSGSHWIYDGGNFVRRSILLRRPIILATINFRLGLFGFAAGPHIREESAVSGEAGTGNYGLRDQRKAMEWVHRYISEFGGDPHNVTVFGAGTGASDIVYHCLSSEHAVRPMFARAIIQSAVGIEPSLPDVNSAGWRLNRVMSALKVSSFEQLRRLPADSLLPFGHVLRVVDDEHFLWPGWQSCLTPETAHHHHHHLEAVAGTPRAKSPAFLSRHVSPAPHINLPPGLPPLIIGDCVADADLWARGVSHWTAPAVVRRLKAVCQSLTKSNALMRAYDFGSATPDEEIADHLLELVCDARVNWPTHAFYAAAHHQRHGQGVFRYVFDQESPARRATHHAADLIYLFDNLPAPGAMSPPAPVFDFCDSFSDTDSDEDEDSYRAPFSDESDDMWSMTTVDEFSFSRVRDTMQERWLTFAYGEAPWDEDKLFVFGPEGEVGERSVGLLEGRRRTRVFGEVLAPLGMELVQKIATEFSRGPPLTGYRYA
ncbi:Alpha/Beta hydrolase protein [Schizophyllum amplum]|uniref:Alpha/Beta hydrolase protein n=1 Tax=Schizophyllum amplum TaxID=97359 RepID=A0A550BY10_9AGAR|nr:Alpha/Beta hydrolase protein [Auriculariopsis ampla]